MAYQVHLKEFEGPLDLLLHLVNRSKVDIHELRLAQLTGQYMEYMDALDELDMDMASEFLAIAAALLEIKSRALLPRPEPVSEDEDEDPEETLRLRLIEYQKYKQGSETMRQMEEKLNGVYYKLPEDIVFDTRIELLEGISTEQLCEAFARVLARKRTVFDPVPERVILRDSYTVQGKVRYIALRLKAYGHIAFMELFEEDRTRSEIVATFLALLELLKSNTAFVVQETLFGEIMINSSSPQSAQEA